MAESKDCDELRKALADARARLEPAARGAALSTGLVTNVVASVDETEPHGTVGLEDEIRNLEQALVDAGCE